jgi:hypothetical protein
MIPATQHIASSSFCLLFHTRLWNQWKRWDALTPYASVLCARPEVRILAFGSCHFIRQLNRRIRRGCRTFPVERFKGCSIIRAFLWRKEVHAKIAVPHIPVADRILRCVEAIILATGPLALLLIEEAKFNVLMALSYILQTRHDDKRVFFFTAFACRPKVLPPGRKVFTFFMVFIRSANKLT